MFSLVGRAGVARTCLLGRHAAPSLVGLASKTDRRSYTSSAAPSSGQERANVISLVTKGQVVEAEKILFSMEEKPDVMTITAVCEGFAKNGNVEEVKKLIQAIRGRWGETPNGFSLNALVHAYVTKGQIAEAEKLLHSMEEEYGVKPIGMSINTVCRGHAKNGNVEGVRNLMTQMQLRWGERPNIHTHKALMNAFVTKGEVEKAEQVLSQIEKPDEATIRIVLDGYSKQGDQAKVEQARKKFGVSK